MSPSHPTAPCNERTSALRIGQAYPCPRPVFWIGRVVGVSHVHAARQGSPPWDDYEPLLQTTTWQQRQQQQMDHQQRTLSNGPKRRSRNRQANGRNQASQVQLSRSVANKYAGCTSCVALYHLVCQQLPQQAQPEQPRAHLLSDADHAAAVSVSPSHQQARQKLTAEGGEGMCPEEQPLQPQLASEQQQQQQPSLCLTMQECLAIIRQVDVLSRSSAQKSGHFAENHALQQLLALVSPHV